MTSKKSWLNLTALTTEYDRKARLAPALASLLFALPLTVVLGGGLAEWKVALAGTTGLFALAGLALANFASAIGNRLQIQLWPDWPFDAPTNVRLMPRNLNTSPQQRARWYSQIKQTTGLDIQAEVDRADEAAVRATVNDAVERLRNRFRRGGSRARHDQESIRYGSVRNFTGMRPLWLSLAILSCAVSWAVYLSSGSGLRWAIGMSALLVPLFLLAFYVLPGFVRTRARYYCEVFFQLLDEETPL